MKELKHLKRIQSEIGHLVDEFKDLYHGDLGGEAVSLLLTKLTELSLYDFSKSFIKINEEKMYDLAVAQFTGYASGKDQSLIGMIQAMGLTKKEWEKIKLKGDTLYLTDIEKKDIEEFFNKKKGKIWDK